MKVTGNNEILPGALPEKQTCSPKRPAEDFGEILKEKIETSPKPVSPGATVFLNPIAPIHHITLSQPVASSDKETAVKGVENLLDLLDDYRQKLADPRVTLKEIDALVGSISGERDNLSTALGAMQEGEQLRDILNQTLVTASLEIIKFRRGDYIDA